MINLVSASESKNNFDRRSFTRAREFWHRRRSCISFSEGHIIQPNHGCCVQRWCLFNYFGADRQPGADATNFVVVDKHEAALLQSFLQKFHDPYFTNWPSDHVAAQTVQSSCRSIRPAAINLKAVINAICCAALPFPTNRNLLEPAWKVWCRNVPRPNIPALVTATVNMVSDQKKNHERNLIPVDTVTPMTVFHKHGGGRSSRVPFRSVRGD